MSTIATLLVKLGLDTKEFQSGISGVGSTLTSKLTPAAAAVSAAAFAIHKDWDAAVDAIRVGTGATGQALQGLMGDAKAVGKEVPDGFAVIGPVLADLNTRLGLTGKPLQDLTKQMVDLSRITGTDASVNVAAVTRLFGDWSVATEDQSETLDRLFRLSQSTGVEIGSLSELMVQFGSPLRTLGFDFETTAAMLAKFEKEGVNLETVMPGFRMALKNFAQDGLEPAEALEATMQTMRDAVSESDRTGQAFEVFGVRAGADMAAAIREGRFEFDDLIQDMNTGKDTIGDAAKDTLDFIDKVKMLKNNVVGFLGPGAEFVGWFAGGVAAIGPFLMGAGQIAPMIGKLGPGLSIAGQAVGGFGKSLIALAANPVVLIIAGIAALVLAVVWVIKNWEKVKEVGAAVWGFLKEYLSGVLEFLKTLFMNFTPVGLIIQHWDTIKAFGLAIWEGIKSFFSTALGVIKDLFLNFTPLGLIIKNWETIKRIGQEVWNAIVGAIEDARDGIKKAVDKIVGFFQGLWEKIKGIVDKIVKAIKDLPFVPGSPIPMVTWANQAVQGINAAWGKLESPTLTPNFSVPRLAIAGMESGRPDKMSHKSRRGDTNITVHARTDADPFEIGAEVAWAQKIAG